MKRIVLLSVLLMCIVTLTSAQSDYNRKKAEEYQREAEYYQKKANSHYREAEYYLQKAKNYLKEEEYYIKHSDYDKAHIYSEYAKKEMDKYRTELCLASQAEDKAATYRRWAADALRSI